MKNTLFFLFLFFSISASFAEENNPPPESFKDFYSRFISDSAFQVSRIIFPLEGKIFNGEETITPIHEENWYIVKYSIYDIDDVDFKTEIIEKPDLVVHRAYIENSGIQIIMKFQLVNNLWFLIEYTDISY